MLAEVAQRFNLFDVPYEKEQQLEFGTESDSVLAADFLCSQERLNRRQ
jgi:hypothetical protein